MYVFYFTQKSQNPQKPTGIFIYVALRFPKFCAFCVPQNHLLAVRCITGISISLMEIPPCWKVLR